MSQYTIALVGVEVINMFLNNICTTIADPQSEFAGIAEKLKVDLHQGLFAEQDHTARKKK